MPVLQQHALTNILGIPIFYFFSLYYFNRRNKKFIPQIGFELRQ